MTHYFVAVLVSPDSGLDINKSVEALLGPFDEQSKGPEHEEECFCVGRKALDRAYDAAREKFGSLKSDEALDFEAATFRSDPENSSADSRCEFCKGEGKVRTVYNPKGEWDWWRYGGRWDGVIQNKPRDYETHGRNFEYEAHLGHNISTPNFMLDHDIIPAAIVTPDGRWYEEERFEGDSRWAARARLILSKHLGALAVGTDCHK